MAEIANTQEFGTAYLLMFNKLWASDAEVAKLRANPRQYAIESGLPVDADADIQVDETPLDGLFTTEQLVDDWNKTAGVHVLHAPPAPTFDPGELSDVELDTVAAGASKVTVIVASVVVV